MKNIKKFKVSFLFLFVLSLLISCSQQLTDYSKSAAEEKTAVLTISLEDSSARTIAPVISMEDLTGFALYDITEDEEKELAVWTSKADMEKASLNFIPGKYYLVLVAEAGGVTLMDTQLVDLSKGDNSVAFNLAVYDYGTGSGNIEITLTYSDTAAANGTDLQLVNMDDSEQIYSGTVESKTTDAETGKTVVKFSAKDIPAGVYRARTTVVVNSEKYISYSDIIKVYEGYTSEGTYECTSFMKNGNVYTMDDIQTTEGSNSVVYRFISPVKNFNYSKDIIEGDVVTVTINGIALTDLNGLSFNVCSTSALDDSYLVLDEGKSVYSDSIKAGQYISLTQQLYIDKTAKTVDTDCICLNISSNGLESDTKTSHRDSAAFAGTIELTVHKYDRVEPVSVYFDATDGSCDVNVVTRYPGQTISDVIATSKDKYFDGWYDSNGNEVKVVPEEDIELSAKWVENYDFTGDVDSTAENSLIISNEVLKKNSGAVLNVKVSYHSTGFNGSYARVISNVTQKGIWGQYAFRDSNYSIVVGVADLLRFLQGEDCVFYNFTYNSTTGVGWTIDECYLDSNTDDIDIKVVEVNLELDGGTRTNEYGTEVTDKFYLAGDSVSYLGTLTKNGYAFDSLEDSEGNTVTTIPEEDCTLYAKWISAYTISFNTNGGSAIDDMFVAPEYYTFMNYCHSSYFNVASSAEENVNFTSSANIYYPTKEGYFFDCWCTDEACAYPFATSSDDAVQITGNITLYAKWAAASTLSFDTNGGSTIDDVAIASGTKIFLMSSSGNKFFIMKVTDENGSYSSISVDISNPTKDGYTFSGWYKDSDCTEEFPSSSENPETLTADTTVYAKWVQTCTLSIETANGFTDVTFPITDTTGTEFFTYLFVKSNVLENLTKDGYEWTGWYSDEALTKLVYGQDSSEEDTISITGDMTLYAKWEKASKIIFNTNGGSSIENVQIIDGYYVYIELDSDSYTIWASADRTTFFAVDEDVDVPTKDNCVFEGWYTDSDCNTKFAASLSEAVQITADTTLYAKWTEVVSD